MVSNVPERKNWQEKDCTYGHEIEVLVYTETGHFCRFVSRNGWKYPSAQRTAAVSLIRVPHLYLIYKQVNINRQNIDMYVHQSLNLRVNEIFLQSPAFPPRHKSRIYQWVNAMFVLTH